MKLVSRIALSGLILASSASLASAQSGFGQRPTVGIFGGVTLPSGDFSDEVKLGAHAGGLAQIRVYQILDLRVDGAWNKFGEKKIDFTDATLETYATVIYGTANVVVNLGPDSVAYPGDHSASPYLLAGLGGYKLDYDEECSGNCPGFVQSQAKTYRGFNVGAGTNATFGWLRPFVEARYHRIAIGSGARTMWTLSLGLRFR